MNLMSRSLFVSMMSFRRFRIPLLVDVSVGECGWLGYFVWRGTRSVFKRPSVPQASRCHPCNRICYALVLDFAVLRCQA